MFLFANRPPENANEDEVSKEIYVLFLERISTRTLAIMSQRLIGRRLSRTEISEAGKELLDAVGKCGKARSFIEVGQFRVSNSRVPFSGPDSIFHLNSSLGFVVASNVVLALL